MWVILKAKGVVETKGDRRRRRRRSGDEAENCEAHRSEVWGLIEPDNMKKVWTDTLNFRRPDLRSPVCCSVYFHFLSRCDADNLVSSHQKVTCVFNVPLGFLLVLPQSLVFCHVSWSPFSVITRAELHSSENYILYGLCYMNMDRVYRQNKHGGSCSRYVGRQPQCYWILWY